MTGLLYYLCVKIFLTSSFKLFDFRISMSLTVLDLELTEKNINEDLGLFLKVLYKDFHFVH